MRVRLNSGERNSGLNWVSAQLYGAYIGVTWGGSFLGYKGSRRII